MQTRRFRFTASLTLALILAACGEDSPPDQQGTDMAKVPLDMTKVPPDLPGKDGKLPDAPGADSAPLDMAGKDGKARDGKTPDGKLPDGPGADGAPLDHAVPDAPLPDALACPISTTCMIYSKGDTGCVAMPAPQGNVSSRSTRPVIEEFVPEFAPTVPVLDTGRDVWDTDGQRASRSAVGESVPVWSGVPAAWQRAAV